jgi:hypothetical protein
MTVKSLEYALDNYYQHWGLKAAINRLNALKDEYNALYDTASGMDYSGMPHSSTPGNPPLEAVVHMQDKPEDLRAEIAEQRAKILEIHWTNRSIEQALHKLDPREEEIIHLRHCERMEFHGKGRFKGIDEIMHYSADYLQRIKYPLIMQKILKMMEGENKL